MNSISVDLIILVLLSISALLGFARGLTHEVLGFFSWIGAFFASLYGFPYMRPLLSPYISNVMIVNIVGAIIIFIVAFLLFSLLARGVSTLVRDGALSSIDRSLGVLFGVVRGGMLLSLFYIVLSYFIAPSVWPDSLKESRFVGLSEGGAHFLMSLAPSIELPTELTEQFAQKVALPAKDQAEALSTMLPQAQSSSAQDPALITPTQESAHAVPSAHS